MTNYIVTLLKMGLFLPFLKQEWHSRRSLRWTLQIVFPLSGVCFCFFNLQVFAVTLEGAENFIFPIGHGSIHLILDHLSFLARGRKSIF